MPVKFYLNRKIPDIIRNCGVNEESLKFAAGEARRLMNDFVPMNTGKLAESAEDIVDGNVGRVVYSQPYAAFCYYGEGRSFSREKHPKASAFWDKAMLQFHAVELRDSVRKFIKK